MAKLFTRLALTTTLFQFAHPAIAGDTDSYVSGNKLYDSCISKNAHLNGYCLGYIIGNIDARNSIQSILGPGLQCVPPGVTQGQVHDIVVKFLKDHPEARHYTGASEVGRAIREAFPCKK